MHRTALRPDLPIPADLRVSDHDQLAERHRPARPNPRGAPDDAAAADTWIRWQDGTGQLLRWLLAGRPCGPVFLTDRRAPATAALADVCLVTGRARMSYRQAAEIFTAATRQLDPAGCGWTLGKLRLASRVPAADRPDRRGRRPGTRG